ncbi:MAG: sigma-70 family RNA polymerase sigma factor [Planctomycetes bacterium]|nr:sigma-70 family RNA polymerase sigma factor [Planctomycetota bacterium]
MESGWNPTDEGALEGDGRALRRLARALVRDTAAAEDLVQEARLVELERRRRGASGLPSLAGVVRRLALGWRREAARRSEQESAFPRELESKRPDEIAERLELSELVLRTLRGLPEPYRSTLTLYYFEGLSAGAIARRSGVPAGTVRARITRGTEELRARLRPQLERGGGDWRMALLPLAGAVEGTAQWGALLIMGTKWIAWGAAAAALVAFGWYALRGDASLAPAELAHAPVAPSLAEESRMLAASAESERRAEVLVRAGPAPAVAPTRIVARAVDEQERPIAGARLALARADAEAGPASGEDGSLVLELAGEEVERILADPVCEFVARAAGRDEVRLVVDVHAQETNWLGDFVFVAAGTLCGRVLDAQGRGLADALVIATQESIPEELDPWLGPGRLVTEGPHSARSGPDGGFALENLPEGWWIVWASDPARPWSASERVALHGGLRSEPVTLVLGPAEPARTLAGIVLEPDGKPCADASVMLLDEQGHASYDAQQSVRADGRFAFHTRGSDELLRVRARDERLRYAELVREARTGSGELVLHFAEPVPFVVHVLDESGVPVRDATVFAFSPRDRALFPGCDAKTDPKGRAELRAPESAYHVLVDAQGFGSSTQGPFEPGAQARELEFRLQRAAGLRGFVRAGGQGIGGAKLRLLECAAPGQRFVPLGPDQRPGGWSEEVDPQSQRRADSRADGSFVLGAPRASRAREAGRFVLVAEARGFAPARLGPLELANGFARDDLEFELKPGGAIAGLLAAPPGGVFAGWRVLASDGCACWREALVDPQGRFRFEHLSAGRWQLVPLPPPPVRSWSWEEREDAQSAELQVDVVEGRTVEVRCAIPDLQETFLEGRFDVRADPPGIWSVQLVPIDEAGESHTYPLRALLRLDSTFRIRARGYGRYQLLLECSDARWGGAQVSDIVELGPQGALWSGALGFARLAGHVSPRTQLVFGFVLGPGELRASTVFKPGPDGLVDGRWIPRGRVLLADEPHPPGDLVDHPLLVIEAREGESASIDLR